MKRLAGKTMYAMFVALAAISATGMPGCTKGEDSGTVVLPENTLTFDGNTFDIGQAILFDYGDPYKNGTQKTGLRFECMINRNYMGYVELMILNQTKQIPAGKTTYTLNSEPEVGTFDGYTYEMVMVTQEGKPLEGNLTVDMDNSNEYAYNYKIMFTLKTADNYTVSGKYAGYLYVGK